MPGPGTDTRATQEGFELSKTDLRVFAPETRVNRNYYETVDSLVANSSPQELADILALHKTKILSTGFDSDPKEIFNSLLEGIASRIITDESGSRYKKPDQITATDLAKLEVLRERENFDYWKDLRINFTGRHPFRSDMTRATEYMNLPYSEPFLIYLAKCPEDLSASQTAAIRDVIARTDAHELERISCRPDRSDSRHDHLNGKNLLHTLLEGALETNKRGIADALFEKGLGKSFYRAFEHHQEWLSPERQNYNSVLWYSYRGPLHSAVASGLVENVKYALDKGALLNAANDTYGGTPFADAARRSTDPRFREISAILLESALPLPNASKILGQPYRSSYHEQYPIQCFANNGDLDMVVALAMRKAGTPIYEAHTFIDSAPIKLGDYYSRENGHYHPPVYTTKTTSGGWLTEVGREVVPYIKQAAFNLDGGKNVYSVRAGVFDRATKFLIEKGALVAAHIPVDTDPKLIDFAYALRRAADGERRDNPAFLVKTAEFTDGFAEKAKHELSQLAKQSDKLAD